MKDTKIAQHTQGPWTLETVKTQIGICHCIGPFPPNRPGDKPSHACIYVDGRYKPEADPESLANARLIAAAPELLSACKAALKRLSFADPCNQPTGNPASAENQGTFVQLEDAIAKAEGKL